ncbi:MAG: Crp/Fnr family transcriptional regulator [Planctomycetaceae bacterium]|nr:Crp/Fnr family transcriptional regulator [Planctomycetaceae bacterium]
MEEKFWYLKQCDLFSRLTPEQVEAVEARCRVRTFNRGSLIYLPSDQNDAVLLLASGRVKIYHLTAEGKQALLALIDPGELFGELAVFAAGQRDEFAETMEKSVAILIPRDVLQELMDQHANVAVGITRLMGLRRQRVEQRLKSLLFRSNRERLVHLLLELAGRYGRQTTDGVQLTIKLSHQDLASIIGSTRETVTVVLGELQAEGMLLIRRRQIILASLDRLATTVNERVPVLPQPARPGDPVLRQA